MSLLINCASIDEIEEDADLEAVVDPQVEVQETPGALMILTKEMIDRMVVIGNTIGEKVGCKSQTMTTETLVVIEAIEATWPRTAKVLMSSVRIDTTKNCRS